MKFIELTEFNLTNPEYNRTLFLNIGHIEVVVCAPKEQAYTVIEMYNAGGSQYYVQESYEVVCAMIRNAT